MTRRDGRSVGELLLQADVTARGLLFDTTGDDAPAMLRTWAEVVESAAELWHALPVSASDATARRGLMAQLEAIATGMHRTQLRRGWPGDGPTDPRLLAMAEAFTRAADLVTRHREPGPPALRAGARQDVHAAQMRTMHALYVGAHAVGVAVRDHVRALPAGNAGKNVASRVTRGVPHGQEALSRLTVFEQLAGAYVGSRLVTALGGERRDPYAGLDRLMNAVAGWDLAAHRALTTAPSAATIATVARGQAMASRTTQVLLHAGARTGTIEAPTYHARLAPALEGSTRAWARLARQSDALTHAGARRVDPALLTADAELQAASRELIHDGPSIAPPELVASRVDVSSVGPVLSEAAGCGLELATAVAVAVTNSSITAPAQAMLTAARRGTFDLGPGELASLGALFHPRDLQLNRSVPLVEPVHAALARSATATVEAMSTASSAISGSAQASSVETTHPVPRTAPRPGSPAPAMTVPAADHHIAR